ncbi:ABC transporter ATP-binding protein [Nanchangia anserum]|nr:ABC transporter ATP-binding protein [Nanchangia anserum]
MWVFTRVSRRAGAGSRRARGELAARYLDAIQGLETLAVTGSARRMADELAAAGEKNRASTMRMLKSNQLVLFVIDAGFYLAFLTLGLVVAAWRCRSGAIGGGEAASIIALTLLMLEPMAQIGGFFYVGMGGRANQAGARKFLGRPRPDSGETGTPAVLGDAARRAPRLTAAGLTFAHPGGTEVLHGLDLDVAPGEHVAIVGPSGQGKTTLINLLTGTLSPNAGTITLDGIPATPPALRAASALVSQSTWLFTGTVRDNLALAAPAAREADMWAALRLARLDEEVRALPHGLDTVIGERGSGLSGGQAQRLSLARAFVSGRRLLVLDEPTSSIDLASEAAITQTLTQIGRDYTVILVTHRRTTLAGCDRVVALAGGVLAEEVER